jgi:WD40 repeat protein
MLLSLRNSHSTCTSAHSGTCMNERAHNLKASVRKGPGIRSIKHMVLYCRSWDDQEDSDRSGGYVAGETLGYAAFISYSHALDGALSRALQTGLERFAKPWYKPRARRVFRDATSLSANPDLWSSIEKALASSTWLVVMASPDAARSPWVDREVAWWLKNKSSQQLLVVLTEGEFAWADDAGHGDGATAALPNALRDAFTQEPRWVDLRWLHNVDQVDQSNPRLQECVADIAATVQGVPKDVLAGEHIRQHRRTMRLARGGVIALALLFIVAVGAAVIARGERNQALQQARIATARQLLTQAEVVVDIDPRAALRLGIAAQYFDDSGQTRAWLNSMFSSTPFAGSFAGPDGSPSSAVSSVALSSDGRTLAIGYSGHRAGSIVLWDLANSAGPRRLSDPLLSPTTYGPKLAFSAAGDRLLATGHGGGIAIWDVADRSRPHLLGQPHRDTDNTVGVSAFSLDGAKAAVSADGLSVQLWNLTDPGAPRPLGDPLTGHAETVQSLAFSPDGRILAVVSGLHTPLLLWDVSDPARPRKLGQPLVDFADNFHTAAFSPDGRVLATGGTWQGVRLWNVADPLAPRVFGEPITASGFGPHVAFVPTSGQLITFSPARGSAYVWDVTQPPAVRQVASLPAAGGTAISISTAAATLVMGGEDIPVTLWDLHGRAQPKVFGAPLSGHSDEVDAVRFSPDGTMLATGSKDGTTVLWDVSNRSQPRRLGTPLRRQPGEIYTVAFSPNGRALATGSVNGSSDGAIQLWDLSDRERPRTMGQPLSGLGSGGVRSMAFSTDGGVLAVGGYPPALFDVRELARPRRIAVIPDEQFITITATSSGRILAVARGSGTGGAGSLAGVRLWDLTDVNKPHQIGQALTGHSDWVRRAAFSATGDRLVTAGIKTAILWDLRDIGRPRRLGRPIEPHGGTGFAVALGPTSGNLLATAGIDGDAILWTLDDPGRLRALAQPLRGHADAIEDVTFSPDGSALATSGNDGPVILWNLTPLRDSLAHTLERACVVAGGGLDPDEWARYLPNLSYEDTCVL